jgi:hypothetical protein
VRQQHGVGQLCESGRELGFVLEHVQAGAGNDTVAKSRHEGSLVHHGPAGGVDEDGIGLHPLQHVSTNDMPGLLIQRNVEGQEVASLHQLRPGHLPDLPGKLAQFFLADGTVTRRPRREDDLHSKSKRAAGGGAGNPAEPGKAQHGAGDIPAQQELRFPAEEFAVTDQPVSLHHAPCGAEDQQHGNVRRRVRQDTRSVAHQDAVPGGGVHVNVVVAHRVVGDALHAGLAEEARIHDVAQLGEDDVEIA